MFSASNLRGEDTFWKLKNNLKAANKPAIMAHANWMNGKEKKRAALIRTGLWVAENKVISGSKESIPPIGVKHRGAIHSIKKNGLREIGANRNLLQIGSAAGNWTCKPIRSELLKFV